MPLYEYKCFDCDTKFEKLTRHENADAVSCPECGGRHARRLLSVFASVSRGATGETAPISGGCACGGNCSCGGH